MITSLPNVDVSLPVEFVSDGELIIPDASSVTWTVREANGSTVTGYVNKPLTGTYSTQAMLVVLAASNTIGSEKVKTRFVEVRYTLSSRPYYLKFAYQLQPFVPLTVGPQDVRALFGARRQELPDEDIDVYGAYLSLLNLYPTLATLLTSTDHKMVQANQAVALQAALVVLPSMPVRILKEEALSNATQIRATIDWAAIEKGLQTQLADLLQLLELEVNVAATGASSIFLVTAPVDVITNA